MSAIRIQNQTLIADYVTQLSVEGVVLTVTTMLDEYVFQFEDQESCDAEFCRLTAELNAIEPTPTEKSIWLLIYHDDDGGSWHKVCGSHEEAWIHMVNSVTEWVKDYDGEMWSRDDEDEPFEPAIIYGHDYDDPEYDYGWGQRYAWFNYSVYPRWDIYEEKVVI